MRSFLFGIALIAAAGCSDGERATGPIDQRPEPEPPETVTTLQRYLLAEVDGQFLPVPSPWGVGEWDYDENAGTWKVTSAQLELLAGGKYTYKTTHRAASGATLTDTSSGRYELGSTSIQFLSDSGYSWSASISATGLTERWPDGRTLVYLRF